MSLQYRQGGTRYRNRAVYTYRRVGRAPSRRRRDQRNHLFYPSSRITPAMRPTSRRVGTIKGKPFPMKLNTKLTVLERKGLVSALTPTFSYVYRPSSYFDFDPGVGGQTFGGYGTLSTIYDRYRVLAFKYICTFCNLESDSITITCEALADSSTPPSGTAVDYTEHAIESGDYAKWTTLDAKGGTGAKKTISGFIRVQSVWGTPEVKTDAGWAGIAGGNPSANTWLRITAYRNNGIALTNGVQMTMSLTSLGYWDEKNDLVS